MWHTTRPFFAVPVRVFRPRPDDTRRASGEGLDGSDPPFLTAGAVSLGGGCGTRCGTWCGTPTPPPGGVAPVRMYPCGRGSPARARAATATIRGCPGTPRASGRRAPGPLVFAAGSPRTHTRSRADEAHSPLLASDRPGGRLSQPPLFFVPGRAEKPQEPRPPPRTPGERAPGRARTPLTGAFRTR